MGQGDVVGQVGGTPVLALKAYKAMAWELAELGITLSFDTI